MDAAGRARENPAMRRSRFSVYATANEPRWIVLYGPQHQVLDCQRLEPAADLSGAMSAAIDRLSAEGWQHGKAMLVPGYSWIQIVTARLIHIFSFPTRTLKSIIF